MQAAWNKDTTRDREDSAKEVYAQEARLSGFMVYSIQNDTWYTPDEFMRSVEAVHTFWGKDKGKQFLVKDPAAGLREMKAMRTKLDQKIEEFTLKIKDYKQIRETKVN